MKSVVAPAVCVSSSSMAAYITIVLAVLVWSAVPTEAQDVSPNCMAAVGRCFKGQQTNGSCGSVTSWLTCIPTTGNVCPLQQPKATFQQISAVLTDICQERAPRLSYYDLQNGQCRQSMNECTQQTSVIRAFNQTDPNRDPRQFQRVLTQYAINTDFWCRNSEENMNCFINNAGVCSVPDDDLRVIKEQLNKVKDVCQPKGAGCPSLVHSVSLLAVCVAVALFRG